MAIAMIFDGLGMTQAQYDQTHNEVSPGDEPPPGMLSPRGRPDRERLAGHRRVGVAGSGRSVHPGQAGPCAPEGRRHGATPNTGPAGAPHHAATQVSMFKQPQS